MRYLLNLTYLLLILCGLPWFLYKSITARKYREGFRQKFLGLVPRRTGDRPCVWFHAVSVGEVRALRTVLEEIQRRHPDWQCVVSTTTRTGMQTARALYPERSLFYCPLDFTWAVNRAIVRVRPDVLVLVELELWPNLVFQARRKGIGLALINGRMSPRSFRGYRRLRFFVKRLLAQFDAILVQSDAYADRFRALGADAARVSVTGSVKFDAIQTDRSNAETKRLAKQLGIGADEIVWVAGSTLETEEQAALDTYLRLKQRHPRLRLILVPRHPERFDGVARLLVERNVPYVRRSLIEEESPHVGSEELPVVLLDTLGELSVLWGIAHVAFVGGSLVPRGGQNMIEPAAFGAAVLFGPHTWNFQETVDALLACQGAIRIEDAGEMASTIESLLVDPELSQKMGEAARRYVVGQQGATTQTVGHLERLLASKCTLWGPDQIAYNTVSQTDIGPPHRRATIKPNNLPFSGINPGGKNHDRS